MSYIQKNKIFLSGLLGFLFVIIFTGLCNYFNEPPQGIHFARQMDSFSFSEYFYLKTYNLFTPGNLNLQSVGGKCGSEFPIIYYIAGLTYKFLGVNFFSLKILSLVVFFIGFIFCLKFIYLLSDSLALSLALTCLFYSSTVLLYYSDLFIPDVHAFSLLMVSFYYYLLYIKLYNKKHLVWMYLIMTFVCLLKVSFLYYDFIFFITIFLANRKLRSNRNNFLYFSISVLAVVAWYFYIRVYNGENFSYYYTTSIKPFWKYPNEKIRQALSFITSYWYPKYYFQSTFHFLLSINLIYLLFLKKEKWQILMIVTMIVSSLFYISLFLIQFIHHDYYIIAALPSLIFISAISFNQIFRRFGNKVWKTILIVVVFILAFLSLNYAKLNLYRRYTDNIDRSSIVRFQISGINSFLKQESINEKAKFIVVGDRTQNGSLVFLNRFGWTYPDFKLDPGSLISNLPLADYLLVLEPSANRIPDKIRTNLEKCPKMIYNSNHIYDLKNYHRLTN